MTMQISSKQSIAGFPAMKVRFLLRHILRYDSVTTKFIAGIMEIDDVQARKLSRRLAELGFIEKLNSEEQKKLAKAYGTRYAWYRHTQSGLSLAFASAARRIKRSTGEAMIKSFMERVRQVNESLDHCYSISVVVLYGSMLSGKQDLGDVDLAIQLTPRIEDPKAFHELTQAKIQDAYDEGRTFRNITEEVLWPRMEIFMCLRARKRSLSIHELRELVQLASSKPLPYRLLLGDRETVREALGPNAIEM
jgi:predicted nucleotidyltransferase